MKKTYYLTIILILAGLLTHGCGSSEETPASDQELLQGAWTGKGEGMDEEFIITFSGSNFELKMTDSDMFYKGTFVLNEEVTPKQGDFTIQDCFMEEYKGTVAKGIYKIENGTFTLAGQEPGVDARPTEFVASGEIQVFTFTRQAEDQ